MKKRQQTPPLLTGTDNGYARVSTDGQSVEAQVRQLTKAGCKKVLREVASRAKTDRAQLRRLLGQLEAGDVLTVTRLGRLARSTRDLLQEGRISVARRRLGRHHYVTRAADADRARRPRRVERDLIRARTSEGRERVRARGVKMGRKPKLTRHQQREAIRRRDSGDETVRDIARSFNVHHATISRLSA